MKTTTRTTKDAYGSIVNIVKTKDTLKIEERIQYGSDGELKEIYILYSDQTGAYEGRDGKEYTYRDEVRYNFEVANRYDTDSPERENVGWSTGWRDSLEGKLIEAKHRNNALKYFQKRRAKLSEK